MGMKVHYDTHANYGREMHACNAIFSSSSANLKIGSSFLPRCSRTSWHAWTIVKLQTKNCRTYLEIRDSYFLDDFSSWIKVFVHTMAETHETKGIVFVLCSEFIDGKRKGTGECNSCNQTCCCCCPINCREEKQKRREMQTHHTEQETSECDPRCRFPPASGELLHWHHLKVDSTCFIYVDSRCFMHFQEKNVKRKNV